MTDNEKKYVDCFMQSLSVKKDKVNKKLKESGR